MIQSYPRTTCALYLDPSGVIEAPCWRHYVFRKGMEISYLRCGRWVRNKIEEISLSFDNLNLFCTGWILQMINIDIFFSWKFRRFRLTEQHWRYPIVNRLISSKIMTWFQSLNCGNQYILKLKLKLNETNRLIKHIADY